MAGGERLFFLLVGSSLFEAIFVILDRMIGTAALDPIFDRSLQDIRHAHRGHDRDSGNQTAGILTEQAGDGNRGTKQIKRSLIADLSGFSNQLHYRMMTMFRHGLASGDICLFEHFDRVIFFLDIAFFLVGHLTSSDSFGAMQPLGSTGEPCRELRSAAGRLIMRMVRQERQRRIVLPRDALMNPCCPMLKRLAWILPFGRWEKTFRVLPLVALTTWARADDAPVTLMSYNVWKSWSQVDDGFAKGIQSIKASAADIVGIQEASPELADRIAGELGWSRAGKSDGSTQIVSRFEIVESMAIDRLSGARIRVSENPLREILVFNCHLDYRFYGPYAALKPGATAESVLQEEGRSERAAQMKGMLEFMKRHLDAADTLPVFLTGDFNGPSHLDWTRVTAHLHGNLGAVEWSPSSQVVRAGMIDSFRAVHPDPVKDPGFTWSAIHKAGEPQDRIDFIYHKGPGVVVRNAKVFATRVEATIGPWGKEDEIALVRKNTWPSDHSAVLVEFLLK